MKSSTRLIKVSNDFFKPKTIYAFRTPNTLVFTQRNKTN